MPAKIHALQIQQPTSPDSTLTAVDFDDSSFFNDDAGQRRSLPSPSDVLARSKDFTARQRPTPVTFNHLDLLVKFGPCVVVEEALFLRALQTSLLTDKVPTPEVYGWRVQEGITFIYMELIRGDILLHRWDSFSDSQKTLICGQLREIVFALRQAGQVSGSEFIGSINRKPLANYVFQCIPDAGPFGNVKDFNDWFSSLPQSQLPDQLKYRDPYRDYLPDTGSIKLTHGDLHRENIIISTTDSPRVVTIIDWAHAGWYPEYWEYCKALYTAHYESEWRKVWIPKFLAPYDTEFEVFGEYVLQIGAV